MKNVIVTGGAGFIGTEIVKQLLRKKYVVRVIDDLSKNSSKPLLGCEFFQVDLTDLKKTKEAFKGMDVCINLAAKIGGIGYFHKYPATILSENNRIYSSTFEAAISNNLKQMIYISSSMIFELATSFPTKESDIINIPPPISAYGISKLIGEKYCYAFWEQYKLPFTICRPFNAYGINELPGEEVGDAHVIPDLIKKILDGQYPLEILGNGDQIRCFTHVSDLARGIISTIGNKHAINDDFNLADSHPISINDLAIFLWKLSGKKEPIKITYKKGFPNDIQKRIPDTKKARKKLQWKSQITLESGLKEIMLWLKNYRKN